MARIHIIDETLANQIAAGEVVERPASVVKELVENALDANAHKIEIEVIESGLQRIRVSDDGVGMDEEDAILCFERHATSKIQHQRDLFRIRTLGFRGEALPSIAAVSKVELITRNAENSGGIHLWVEGGSIVKREPDARNVGTDIIVKDLFYNTPARLKYVKSLQTEFSHISDYVTRMAMLRSDVRFRLYHDGRLVFQTPGDGQQLHVMAVVYGNETAKQMIPLAFRNEELQISGCICAPEINRASRTHMNLFVNGRSIRNYAIQNGIVRAYHTRLPIHRFPIVSIAIEMDPVLVDPNVHPNKMEVRFSEEQDVVEAIVQAVNAALNERVLIPSVSFSEASKNSVQRSTQKSEQQTWSNRDLYASPSKSFVPKQASDLLYQPPSDVFDKKETQQHLREPVSQSDHISEHIEWSFDTNPPVVNERFDKDGPYQTINDASKPIGDVPRLRAVAQVLGMYVIAQDEDAMYLIDQHAAHERVLFETFNKKIMARGVHKLPLLVPYSYEVRTQDLSLLDEHKQRLEQIGIEIESFGGNSILVRTVPDIWEGLETQRLVQETIDELLVGGYQKQPLQRIEERIIMKACKAAIKANCWLSMQEMQALCDQLSGLDNPFSCPHGRPVIIKFSTQDLEKQFKRIQ